MPYPLKCLKNLLSVKSGDSGTYIVLVQYNIAYTVRNLNNEYLFAAQSCARFLNILKVMLIMYI